MRFSLLLLPVSVSATAFNDAANGNWNIGTTWGGGCSSSCTEGTDYPGENDTATIDSHTVTLDANASVDDVSIAGGTLDMDSYRLDVYGNWTKSSGTFTPGTGTVHMVGSGGTITSGGSAFNNLTLNDGLVGYWKLDETEGTTAADSSAYGNDGTLNNMEAADWKTDEKSPVRFTNTSSLDFDGSDEYVVVPHDEALNVGTGNLSASLWIKRSAVSGIEYLFTHLDGSGVKPGYMLRLTAAGKLQSNVKDASNDRNLVSSSEVDDGSWHHIALFVGSSMQFFVDGTETSYDTQESPPAGTKDNTREFRIGARDEGAAPDNFFYGGLMDDLRLYNRALSAREVSNLASGGYADGDNGTATFTLGAALDVDDDLQLIGGVLDVSGDNYGVNLGGDFVNYAGESSFTAQNGTVTLDGGNQTFSGSGATFYNLTKVDTDDSSDSIVTFAAGSVYTVSNWWTLTGNDSADRINLVSSVPEQAWNIDPQTYRTLDFVDVTDSVNKAGTEIKVPTPDNVDGGGNTNWTFGGSRLVNVPSGITARLRDSSSVDPTATDQGGNRYVRLYKESGGDATLLEGRSKYFLDHTTL